MSKLDPRIEVIRERYGLDAADFWELPQKKGTWVAKHAALEIAAVKAGIVFDMPVIVEQNAAGLITSMIVQGVMGDRTEWATGETNPSNYHVSGRQPSYPWAMAEKRAKDRVILKLIGIHGLVYSEDEMSGSNIEREEPPQQAAPVTFKSSAQAKRDGDWPELKAEVDACLTLEDLNMLVASRQWQAAVKPLPKAWVEQLRDYVQDARDGFEKRAAVPSVAPNFDNLEQRQ